MNAATQLRQARLRARLTQRALASRAGVPQSTVGRIESASIEVRTSTLDRLLRACGYQLEVHPRLGQGVDRTLLRQRLALSQRERIETMAVAARNIERFSGTARKAPR